MLRVVSDIELEESARGRLKTLPGVAWDVLPTHKAEWDLPAELLIDRHVLLCKIPPRNLFQMGDLRLLQISTVGYEHLRHLQLADPPFRVCNARGVFDTAIAEWNVAMMVNLVRDLRGMIRNQERGDWVRSAQYQQEIHGRTVGLWGYGGIGRETARLAKAMGLTVHVHTRSGVGPRHNAYTPAGTGDPEGRLPDRVFTAGQELKFLAGLDFLILALPHTKASDGLIGERELRRLPKSAFLLNPARGPIVQEAVLLEALRQGWIAGAALDTHFAYPLPPDHPLWQFSNAILTPHISGADHSRNFPARLGDLFVLNVERLLKREPLLNEVTAEEWREAIALDAR
jgi:phosphoglycerate dehydrogenase-like enzyme